MQKYFNIVYRIRISTYKGKTCLVRRFCQGIFPTGQAATIGVDFLIKTLEINGEKIKV